MSAPFELIAGTVVQVEPPVPPTIVLTPPGPGVVLSPPTAPLVSVMLPELPNLVAAPTPSSTPVIVVPGPPGPRGSSGGESFEFNQPIPQAVWVVNHQLGRYPVAWSLYDIDGRLCDEYLVEHVDTNNCLISMDTPTAGLIRLI